jgi:predicted transcriptional regulator of viral defense system
MVLAHSGCGPNVKPSVRRGSKKHQALLALLEVARRRSIVAMEELISEVTALGLSRQYAKDLVGELLSSGVLKRIRGGAYAVDVEALEKVLKEVE